MSDNISKSIERRLAVQLPAKIAELQAEIERLKVGIQKILDYHASNHRVSLPMGGTARYCAFLLQQAAEKKVKP